MANRAYLFATDSAVDWKRVGGIYYDSRHTIPVGWYLLFDPDDVLLAERQLTEPLPPQRRTTSCKVVRLRAERTRCIDRFARRRSVLDAICQGRVNARRVAFFEAILRNWSGRYLVMDPDEILQGEVEDDIRRLVGALRALTAAKADVEAFRSEAGWHVAVPSVSDEASDWEVQVLGCTYGDLANRLWKEIVEGPA